MSVLIFLRGLSKTTSKSLINFHRPEFQNKHGLCCVLSAVNGKLIHDISSSRSQSSNSKVSPIEFNIAVDASPQGIQGDFSTSSTDDPLFKLWLKNCKRYGLANCREQLQGIQSGEKTVAQVLAEQENLITELLQKYEVVQRDRAATMQGLQESTSAFPVIDSPCPQGVQGDDCVQFKLWLENCYKFGYQDCIDQYQNFKHGRKTLSQIFAEQERDIREAATILSRQRQQQQRRSYSTSTSNTPSTTKDHPNDSQDKQAEESDKVPLSQKDKLKRAVKEYGSTVIVFHVSISLMSLGFFYALVSSGVDVVGLLRSAGIGESILQSKLAAGTGTFVVSYAVHKVFAPVRIATTLTATPLIVRYLRKIGFLKVKVPPASKS